MIEANNSNSIPNNNNAKQNLYRTIFTANILSLLAGVTYGCLFHGKVVIVDYQIGDIGGIIGVIIWIAACDRLSRKMITYSICAVHLLEYFIIIVKPVNIGLRSLIDANISITILCNLHFLNEITFPEQKGAVFSSVFLSVAIGNDITQIANLNFPKLGIYLLVPLFLVLYLGITYTHPLPESPSYLMGLGDEIGAAQSLTQFRENKSDVQEEIIKLREVKGESIFHKISLLFSKEHLNSMIFVIVISIPLLHYPIDMITVSSVHSSYYSFIELSIMYSLAFIVFVSTLAFVRYVNRKIGLLLIYTMPLLYHVLIIFYVDYSLYFLIFTFVLVVFDMTYIYGFVTVASFLFCEMFPSYLLNYVWCTYLVCQNVVALLLIFFMKEEILSFDMQELMYIIITVCTMFVIAKVYNTKNEHGNSDLENQFQSNESYAVLKS